ncbi:autotransporter domain-containing protein [Reyranella sp.]|uniref:autotransporter family protein n=1 Tax=Reyranella sp. TaxID=1929291 RepID=UPI003D14E37D
MSLVVAAGLSIALGAGGAQAQDWTYYSAYKSLSTISFTDGPMAPGNTAKVFLTLNGNVNQFIIDTGSTGIAASSAYFTPGPNDIAQGPGKVSYSSSGFSFKGTWYKTNVGIMDTAKVGAHGKGAVAGAQLATSEGISILAITEACDKKNVCKPAAPDALAYMGVGYNRNAVTEPPPPGSLINAFTNISSLASGAPIGTYRQGYVISNAGITLGLSSEATRNFGVMKLLPDPANATALGIPWSTAPMTVMVDDSGKPASGGTMLPDTGIDYMFLHSGSDNPFSKVKCGKDAFCAVDGTRIRVWLPGQTGAAATFVYVVPTDKEAEPGRVENDGVSTTPFINTGRQFYDNFTYYYDDVGGFVGYKAVPGGTWDVAATTPSLSLTGTLALPSKFQDTLPVTLAGSTALTAAGTATFDATITSIDNSSLTLGAGTFVFNGTVDVGAGTFALKQGGASVNAGLSASQITVSAAGLLTNAAGSSIVGTLSNAGIVNNNGIVFGNVTNTGLLTGGGTIFGDITNFGAISPGNSIGTMTISGNYTHSGGSSYQAEVNGAGQADRLNVIGGATLQGGMVNVIPMAGSTFGARTTYTLLNATGGLTGIYASVTDPYPFLKSRLSYDANNAYLTLQAGGFAAGAQTATQSAVGQALDSGAGTASGDFSTVLGTLALLPSSQVMPVLTALSGQNYSSFSSALVQGAALFMNNFASQTGGGAGGTTRTALAEVCDVACDTTAPGWGAWGGALGGLGTIGATSGTGAVTYNAGGFAAGLDRTVAPGLRVGVTAGYTTGTQWTQGFSGLGTSNTFLTGLYGNYRQDRVYVDALAGYAYSYNQMTRQIAIPGLGTRTALGGAGANQWYGQVEGGYRFDLGTNADASVTPFARLQGYTGALNGFAESGAQSLNLTVAGQTTNSLRSVVGAQLAGAFDLGWRETLGLQFRLGWSHEYADTARPVTASLAGAPLLPFTTYGVSPQRDAAILGFSANTAIAETASLYLRYDGAVSGQDSAHALTAGVRMTW